MSPPTPSSSLATAAQWFDSRPINIATRSKLTAHLRQRLEFVGIPQKKNVQMLDYACGSGFMSRVFAPYVSHITGMDSDASTIEMYKSRVGDMGTKHIDTCVVVLGNLLEDAESLDAGDFELVTVGAALHAFPSAGDAVKCLASRVAPGGVLFVQDRFDDGEYGGKGPRGFTEEGMRSMMSAAGLVDFRLEALPEKMEIEVMDGEVVGISCFVARGMKPSGD